MEIRKLQIWLNPIGFTLIPISTLFNLQLYHTFTMTKKAIIIGAGPAGLTAAYELLKKTDITPIILEKSGDIGGISKTVNYKGNRMDIGGHRFFSKSDRVMQWWLNIMPVEPAEEKHITVTYQRHTTTIRTEECANHTGIKDPSDKVMLIRNRLSRIYFLRRFFTYPIQLSLDTLKKLGLARTTGILLSYVKARLFPQKSEKTLEDFFINRFGNKLYRLFFKDYTEKVWGVSCTKISAEWGAQRIKGISIGKAIAYAVKSLYPTKKSTVTDIGQKGVETSLIEKFLYPKFGPGQLWEEVARQVQEMGGLVLMNQDVSSILSENKTITGIETVNSQTGETGVIDGDYFFSTMPVQELIAGMKPVAPSNVREVAKGLQYRDFITVGVLLAKMPPPGEKTQANSKAILPDTWIYIQERDVKVGRLQIFNNWSPYMVKDPETVWVGMEYFCNKGDEFWAMTDQEVLATAITELNKMGLAVIEDVLDGHVLRVEKTYPAYFGTYNRFEEIKSYTDRFENLFLVGRNGMHKYNNSDHSMLTAMVAVDNIVAGVTTKANIWSINTEREYHEEKIKHQSTPQCLHPSTPKQSLPIYRSNSPRTEATVSFKSYVFKNTLTKWYLGIAIAAIAVQFLVFKHFYPQAGYINGDSYVYLQAAYWNFDVNTYPTGYSKFLRIFSTFSTSDTALVAFQYLMMQCSALFFLYTFFFFYKPGKVVQTILLASVVFNPLFLYLSNYILSDALFFSLSISWFTSLLWILHGPTKRLIALQAVILFVAFTVRYNALFYPILGSIAFLLTRQRAWLKIVSIGSSVLLLGLFFIFTSNKYKELSGKWQFSPFTGWQIANNAMYAYKFVDSSHLKPAPARFHNLDQTVRAYFASVRNVKTDQQEMSVASTAYMWDPRSPLWTYMNLQFRIDSTAGNLQKWATVAPLYEDYGRWLIRKYPLEFARHFLWPNTLKYYAPPVEFLETYNMGIDTVRTIAQSWFHYKNNKVKTMFNDFKVSALDYYPIFAGILNLVFLVALLFFILLKGIRTSSSISRTLILVAAFWIVNFGFSVFASPIALRFQVFPLLVFLSVTLYLLEYIWTAAFSQPGKTQKV
jgi:protoporphyrinogen oxidase